MSASPSRSLVLVAFAAVYVVWGSTYLAIRFAIETLPGFLMGGVRFLVAGALMYGWARATGAPRPTGAEWRSSLVTGALMLLVGNGMVIWAEYRIPSGLTALIITIGPAWMVLLDWLRPGGKLPTRWEVVGIVLGFAGVATLVGPSQALGRGHVDPLAAAGLALASLSWAAGSIYSRHTPAPASGTLATGMKMLVGGGLLTVLGTGAGEWAAVDIAAFSVKSILALLYLIVFGAIVGFSAYLWLLKVTTPARASTHAFVNPLVAVFLGWALAGEPLTARILIASTIIVGSVALITFSRATALRSRTDPRPVPQEG